MNKTVFAIVAAVCPLLMAFLKIIPVPGLGVLFCLTSLAFASCCCFLPFSISSQKWTKFASQNKEDEMNEVLNEMNKSVKPEKQDVKAYLKAYQEKQKITTLGTVSAAFCGVGLSVYTMAALFCSQHWPGSKPMMFLALMCFVVAIVMSLIANKNKCVYAKDLLIISGLALAFSLMMISSALWSFRDSMYDKTHPQIEETVVEETVVSDGEE